MQTQKTNLTITGLSLFLLFSCTNTNKEDTSKNTDTITHGSNELANTEQRETFGISDFNTDNPEIKNIERPAESVLKTTIDTTLLFGIWTSDPDGPHADFELSKKSFFIVDYDGNGDMPYILNDTKLKIFYNDFTQDGEIVEVSKDSLRIRWIDTNNATSYSRWKN